MHFLHILCEDMASSGSLLASETLPLCYRAEDAILAIPGIHSSSGLDTHPALPRSMRMLRRHGVHLLYEPEKYPPNNTVPASRILDSLDTIIKQHAQEKNEMSTNLPSGV